MQKRKRLLIGMVIFSVILTSFSFYFYQVFYGANVLQEAQPKTMLVDKDDNFDSLRNNLLDAKIIDDVISFSFVAKVLGYQDNVKPGLYFFEPEMTNLQAVRRLRSGDQVPVDVTFNNVRFKEDLVEKIVSTTGIDGNEFLRLLNDDDYVAELGFNKETIMAMFIPNTYEVYWTISEKDLFARMKQEYDKFWNSTRKAKAAEVGLSPEEISTLAAIVQDEMYVVSESPKIAGLYLNRIKKNMLLQADPTVKFALGDFSIQRVLTADLRVDSPYNTYKHRGLPPGPINLPTIASIDAVLNYEKHDYIYMCAKEDFSGYHRFAEDLTTHNKNAKLLHRALNKRNIYR